MNIKEREQPPMTSNERLLKQNIDFCLDTFGEDRVFFGGDWPVCTLTATFETWYEALQRIVQDRSEAFQRKLFHDNAEAFYRL